MNQQNIQTLKEVISAHLQSGNFADAAAVWQQQTGPWKASGTGGKAFRSITTKAREQMTALLAAGNLDDTLALWSALPEEMRNDPDMQRYYSEQLLTAYNDPVEMESRRAAETERQAAAAKEQRRLETNATRAQVEAQRAEQPRPRRIDGGLNGLEALLDESTRQKAAAKKAAAEVAQRRATNPTLEDLADADGLVPDKVYQKVPRDVSRGRR